MTSLKKPHTKPRSRTAHVVTHQKKNLNIWYVAAFVVVIAIVGIVYIRFSHASGVLNGRMPKEGEPHIDYSVQFNGHVILKKSTNGETKEVNSINEAYSVGQTMYNEMIAEQSKPAPEPEPTPSHTPNPTTNPDPQASTDSSSTNPSSQSTTPSTSSDNSAANSPNQSNTPNTSNPSENSTASSSSQTSSQSESVTTIKGAVTITQKIPDFIHDIQSVTYSIGSDVIGSSSQAPYGVVFISPKKKNGTYTLTSKIKQKNGTEYTITNSISIQNSAWERFIWAF